MKLTHKECGFEFQIVLRKMLRNFPDSLGLVLWIRKKIQPNLPHRLSAKTRERFTDELLQMCREKNSLECLHKIHELRQSCRPWLLKPPSGNVIDFWPIAASEFADSAPQKPGGEGDARAHTHTYTHTQTVA